MRRLQAGLFPEARRRIGKCLDCGEEGALAGVGGGFGFLVVAGACAHVREPLLATRTTKAKKSDRSRKGMRLNESSAQRIPRGRRHAQLAISRQCESVSELPTIRELPPRIGTSNSSLLRKRMFRQSGLLPILRELRKKWLQAPETVRRRVFYGFSDSGSLNTDA